MGSNYKRYPKSKEIDPRLHDVGTFWGTLGGQYILLYNLRNKHLQNIKEHIEVTNSIMVPYIEAEIKRRLIKKLSKTKTGKILYGK